MLLLTGATGFLGSRLCAELLRRTDEKVACLVRADTPDHAERRVRERLAAQDFDVADSPRLRFAVGDVTLPRLGLDQRVYDELAAEVTDVYHCGASVNMAGSYRRLAAVNTVGTARVLKFCEAAGDAGSKRLHHISTLSVFLRARRCGLDSVPEHAMPTEHMHGDFSYPRSKYEAETLVAAHARKGLPATVYRPGLILADWRDGAAPPDDFIACLLAASIATGRFPETDGALPVITVDHAARMIAALSLTARTPSRLGIYPVLRPEPLPVHEFAEQLRAHGYEVRAANEAQWLTVLREHGQSRHARAMRALTISRYLLGLSPDTLLPRVDCTETAKVCAQAGITSPPLDHSYFSRALCRLADHGAITHPAKVSSPP